MGDYAKGAQVAKILTRRFINLCAENLLFFIKPRFCSPYIYNKILRYLRAIPLQNLKIIQFHITRQKTSNFKGGEMKGFQKIILAFLLAPISLYCVDSDIKMLISYAANGQLDDLKELVEQGISVNSKNEDGVTALMGASLKGHLRVVQYLTSKRADLNVKESQYEWTALMLASKGGRLDIVKHLVAKGAHINMKAKNGKTALMIAAHNGHLGVVKYLIAKGAKVNERAKHDTTAIVFAAMAGHLDVVKYLIAKGADVNAMVRFREYGTMGFSALDIAKTKEIKEVLKKAGGKSAKDIKARI